MAHERGVLEISSDPLDVLLPVSSSARGNTADRVAVHLRQAIVSGQLPPGTALVATDLAVALNVSRTPVRDALRALASEDLVTLNEGAAAIVTTMTPEDVDDLYGVREHLEGLAARLAAQRSSRRCLHEFAELMPQIEAATRDERFEDLSELNFEFHAIIRRGAENAFLDRALRQCQDAARRFPQRGLRLPGRAAESIEEHAVLAVAISQGDGSLAEKLALGHMRRLADLRIESLKKKANRRSVAPVADPA